MVRNLLDAELDISLNKVVGDILRLYKGARHEDGKIDPQTGFMIIKVAAGAILDALTPVIRAE